MVDPCIEPPARGDVPVLLELYRAHRDEVARLVAWLVGPERERGPVIAAVFVAVFRALGPRDPRAVPVALVRRVVVREALAHARRRSEPTRDPAASLLGRVLDALPWRHRVVFVLSDLARLDEAELAAVLEVSPRRVAARLARARRAAYAAIAREPAFDHAVRRRVA